MPEAALSEPCACRFKEATGKSVELLEKEKTDKAHLESTNQAQACDTLPCKCTVS